MTDAKFDPVRAIREEIQGLSEIRGTLIVRERRAQQNMIEAETEFNALARLRGFVDSELERKRTALISLTV